jgi:hypothetical protein
VVQRHSVPGPRLIVVSYMANAPLSPRGIRTEKLLEALQRDWYIELIAGPTSRVPDSDRAHVRRPLYRKTFRFAHSALMLDKFEPWSRRRFRCWRPDAAGALLIGFPFSPLVCASRRLAERGIPYVVDAGDPWVLTGRGPELRGLGLLRGRAAEHRLYAGAAGAVVTTEAQASALRAIFRELPLLVRPNGFAAPDHSSTYAASSRRPSRSESILRLAHFGGISSDRVDVASFLKGLARSGVWSKIEFHQYGSDWNGALRRLSEVKVVFHEPRPWSEILAIASEYDLAAVIGNRDPMLLPSKAVVYLQLPIPRLAIVEGSKNALRQYLADKPGWILVCADDADAAVRIRRHLSRGWSAAELAPPATESWDHVSRDVSQFLHAALNGRVS